MVSESFQIVAAADSESSTFAGMVMDGKPMSIFNDQGERGRRLDGIQLIHRGRYEALDSPNQGLPKRLSPIVPISG